MQTELTLVIILVPESMEDPIAAELLALGAPGYSAWTMRGRGSHGARPSAWTGANVRIEAAVSAEVAEKIVQRLQDKLSAAVPFKLFTAPITLRERG
jgi:hypothetical protein